MQLTEEQQRIIAYVKQMKRGGRLKVEAKAGSGKTSTLVEVARANPDKRFLYLAFNKAIVNEAKDKFPKNVVVKTTHSLAYGKIVTPLQKQHRFRVQGKLTMFELKDWIVAHPKLYKWFLKNEPNGDAKTGRQPYNWDAIAAIGRRYDAYLNSDEPETEQSPLFRAISEAIRHHELSYTHSFYLKEYQLLRSHPEIDEAFDFILLDEAQDTNPVTMGIVNDVRCAKILVGDSNQSIYAFRGAINALTTFDADATLYLTCCFRCNQAIVDRANYFLKKYDPSSHTFHPMFSGRPDGKSAGQSAAIIARTNTGLIAAFQELLHDVKRGKLSYDQIIFTRPPSEIFAPSLNVLKFWNGATTSELATPYRYFTQFHSLGEFKDYAEETLSYEVMLAIKLVEKYGSRIPAFYAKAQGCTVCDFATGNHTVTLTTAHSAKGLEFDEVALLGDFNYLAEIQKQLKELIQTAAPASEIKSTMQTLYEETNLYYVATTRARSVLFDLTPNSNEFDGKGEEQEDADEDDLIHLSFKPRLFFLPEDKREKALKELQAPPAKNRIQERLE